MASMTGVVCRVRVELRPEEGAIVARNPELHISNHGNTPEEAMENLLASLEMFFEVCAEKGTLVKILREKGVDHVQIAPDDKVIDVPIPLLALENARSSAG